MNDWGKSVFEILAGLSIAARKLQALGSVAVRIRMHPETHAYALALLPTAPSQSPSGNIVDFTGVRFDADPDVPRGVARVMYSDGREEDVLLGTYVLAETEQRGGR